MKQINKRAIILFSAINILLGFTILSFAGDNATNKKLAEAYIAVWNNPDAEALKKVVTADMVYSTEAVGSQPAKGPDALLANMKMLHTAYSDWKVVADEYIFAGNRIIIRWTNTGTNDGPMGERPATNKKVKGSGALILTIVDGKISQQLNYFNEFQFMVQQGFKVVPAG